MSSLKLCNFRHLFYILYTIVWGVLRLSILDTFWTRISYVFKACGVSKRLEYNWINVLFSYIGFAIYKSYFCCERGKKQFNILNILIEEFKVLETYYHTKNFKCNMLTIFRNKLCR